MPGRRFTIAFLVGSVVLGCASAPPESASPSGSAAASAATSPAPGTPRASAGAPSGNPTTDWRPPRTLAWIPIATLPVRAEQLPGAFSAGILALGARTLRDENEAPVALFSVDGRSWDTTELMTGEIEPCPGWVKRPDVEVVGGWAAGGGAIIAGAEYAMDIEACGMMRPVLWLSDGRGGWQDRISVGDDSLIGSLIEGVWAVPEGWELAIRDPEERLWLWRSPDGASWRRIAHITDETDRSLVKTANDGTRVLVIGNGGGGAQTIMVSTDGATWRTVDGPLAKTTDPDETWTITEIVPPDRGLRSWTVFTWTEDTRPAVPWTTDDFVTWHRGAFPNVTFTIAQTSEGILALGHTPCVDTGTPCPDDDQYFLSQDGLAWEPLSARVGPTSFAEGPAGILGMGSSPRGDSSTVYRLEPYTDEEAFLLAGIRPGAGERCAPLRTKLPPAAKAGVQCRPATSLVDEVGFYLFANDADLLQAYFARVADAGLARASGRCTSKPAEGSYAGSDATDSSDPHRVACFVNEFGKANYRVTYPESLVYVGVLGTGAGIQKLGDWTWKGGDGRPGIWADPRT